MYHGLSIHQLKDIQLPHPPVLATTNKASIHIYVLCERKFSFLLDKYSWVELLDVVEGPGKSISSYQEGKNFPRTLSPSYSPFNFIGQK